MKIDIKEINTEITMDEFIEGFFDAERFEKSCSFCHGFGKTWACPPYNFDPIKLWRSYDRLAVIGKKILVPDSLLNGSYSHDELNTVMDSIVSPVKHTLFDELLTLEHRTPYSMMLSAGGCDICEECVRSSGKPCIHPELLRFSIESLGGDVVKIVEKLLNEKLLWAQDGKLPEYFIIVGGLLLRG